MNWGALPGGETAVPPEYGGMFRVTGHDQMELMTCPAGRKELFLCGEWETVENF